MHFYNLRGKTLICIAFKATISSTEIRSLDSVGEVQGNTRITNSKIENVFGIKIFIIVKLNIT